ncbi:MAG: hypothetical protein ACLR5G_15360 [Eubacteriales bacterium]|nr:hypothetical protein [Clostridiales bacterium]
MKAKRSISTELVLTALMAKVSRAGYKTVFDHSSSRHVTMVRVTTTRQR